MNWSEAESVARAVLYEGYLLYPYRRSALKNRQRHPLVAIAPSLGADGWQQSVSCECLVHGRSPLVEVSARFLQAVGSPSESDVAPQPEGHQHEVVERRIDLALQPRGPSGHLASAETQSDWATLLDPSCSDPPAPHVSARFKLDARAVDDQLHVMSVELCNVTDLSVSANFASQTSLFELASPHALLCVTGGEFVSLLDPPDEFAEVARGCRQRSLWPALVGSRERRTQMLVSPVILPDYPTIAVASRGDFFDATEIDELLSLRVLTLSDREKEEIRRGDPLARQILERTEQLGPEEWAAMHGLIDRTPRDKELGE